jgi:hypothetical protein
MSNEKQSVFGTLSAINFNDKVEKKNNLTYLSWAHAWAEVKSKYPDCSYVVHRNSITGLPYTHDEDTGYMIFTTVTIDGISHDMWLPVMDGANKAMKRVSYEYEGTAWVGGKKQTVIKTVEACSMFDINKTIMRCLTKNLAMFGLGIYIYAGEDIPESMTESQPAAAAAPAATTPAEDAKAPLKKGTADWDRVVAYVTANKGLGIEKIGQQLTRKYTISPALKKEIATIVNQ